MDDATRLEWNRDVAIQLRRGLDGRGGPNNTAFDLAQTLSDAGVGDDVLLSVQQTILETRQANQAAAAQAQLANQANLQAKIDALKTAKAAMGKAGRVTP